MTQEEREEAIYQLGRGEANLAQLVAQLLREVGELTEEVVDLRLAQRTLEANQEVLEEAFEDSRKK